MRVRLIAVLLGVMLTAALAPGWGAQPKLSGCFYHYAARLGWTAQQWQEEMQWLAELGMTTLIVTTAVHETQAFYPSRVDGLTVMDTDSLEMVFTQADQAGIQILLMPYDTSAYWVRSDAAFYDDLTSMTCRVTADTYDLYRHHPSLIGYYYSPEFWYPASTTLQEVWQEHFIQPVGECVKGLNPALLVSCAPFVGATPSEYDSGQYQAFWANMLAGSPNMDVLMLQDGIGAFEYTPDGFASDEAAFLNKRGRTYKFLDRIYADTQARCAAAGKTLWADLEAFETVGLGYPPHISRIIKQLAVAAPRTQNIVAFEGLYLSRTTCVASVEFDENYRRYLEGRTTLENITRGCDYTLGATAGTAFPDDGIKLTDGGQDGFADAHYAGWAAGSAAEATVDLGVVFTGIELLAASFKDNPGAGIVRPEQVAVAVSDDGQTFETVGALTPLDPLQRNANCVYRLRLAAPAAGRYVRFSAPAADGVSVVCSELAAFSTAPQLLSLRKPYTVVNVTPSEQFPDEGNELTDGNSAPRWYAQVGWNRPAQPLKIIVDLQEPCDIQQLRASFMVRAEAWMQGPASVTARFSVDGMNYGEPVALAAVERPTQQYRAVLAAQGRYVQLEVTGAPGSWVMMSELSVLGEPDAEVTVPVQLGQLEVGQSSGAFGAECKVAQGVRP